MFVLVKKLTQNSDTIHQAKKADNYLLYYYTVEIFNLASSGTILDMIRYNTKYAPIRITYSYRKEMKISTVFICLFDFI